jgi:hypothetical protein
MITKNNPNTILDVLDKFKKKACQYNSTIDAISTEIKLVEKSLSEANIHVPFKLLIKSEEDPQQYPSTDDHQKLYPFPSGYRIYIEYKLAWDLDEQSESYRLLYIITNAEIVYHNIEEQDLSELRPSKIVFKRPFIETKLPIRLEYSKYLKTFVDSFSDAIEVNSIKTSYKPEIYDQFIDCLMQKVSQLREDIAYIHMFAINHIESSELVDDLYERFWASAIFSACCFIDSSPGSMSIMKLLDHNLNTYNDSISINERDILEKIRLSKIPSKLKNLRNKLGRAHIDKVIAINRQKQQHVYEKNKLHVAALRQFSGLVDRALEILSQRSSKPVWYLLHPRTKGPSQLLKLLQWMQQQ